MAGMKTSCPAKNPRKVIRVHTVHSTLSQYKSQRFLLSLALIKACSSKERFSHSYLTWAYSAMLSRVTAESVGFEQGPALVSPTICVARRLGCPVYPPRLRASPGQEGARRCPACWPPRDSFGWPRLACRRPAPHLPGELLFDARGGAALLRRSLALLPCWGSPSAACCARPLPGATGTSLLLVLLLSRGAWVGVVSQAGRVPLPSPCRSRRLWESRSTGRDGTL